MDERMRWVWDSFRKTVKLFPAGIDLELPVGSPLSGDRAMTVGDAFQYAAEPQQAGIEDPGAVARLQRDDVHGASMTIQPQLELGETWPRAWNLIAVS